MERRYVRQIFACVLAGTVLVGGALALKKGDSVVSLNYVEDRFQPSAVEEGTEAADAMLQKSYNNAKKELDALQKAYTGSGDEETANYMPIWAAGIFPEETKSLWKPVQALWCCRGLFR